MQNEKENICYTKSIMYMMEQTVIYFKLKGAQFFNQLNIGVTIDQYAALDAIYHNENICQRDLSKLILKDRSNTGRILNILEEKGFIKRAVETKGKRLVKKIYITTKGTEMIENHQKMLKEAFHKVFEEVSEEEFTVVRQILTKLRDTLSKSTNIQI